MINLFFPITRQMQKAYMRTVMPSVFRVKLVRKDGGSNMALVYEVQAGPVTVSDVATRRLVASVNGEVVSQQDFPADTVNFGELKVNDNDNVVLTLVDVDDAGNVGSPAVVEFVAVDTLAPPVPGQFGVALVREE